MNKFYCDVCKKETTGHDNHYFPCGESHDFWISSGSHSKLPLTEEVGFRLDLCEECFKLLSWKTKVMVQRFTVERSPKLPKGCVIQ